MPEPRDATTIISEAETVCAHCGADLLPQPAPEFGRIGVGWFCAVHGMAYYL
jgi:hypothetical protein